MTEVVNPNKLIDSDLDEVITFWSAYFLQLDVAWKQLIDGVQPKESGCGLIYELDNPMDRPVESFAIADMRQLDITDPHYHLNNETEIYFILEGTGTIVVGNDIHEVGPGDIVATPPGIAHYTISHRRLVLGVINTPPFNPANYVSVQETEQSVGFDAEQFKAFAMRN